MSAQPAGPAGAKPTERVPNVRKVADVIERHGDAFVDEYAWMDRDEESLKAHLTAENAYTEAMTSGNHELEQRLVAEFSTRTKQSDLTVPTLNGGHWYYTRSREGSNHALYCRCPATDPNTLPVGATEGGEMPGEEVLLDGNAMVGPQGNFAVGAFKISPDENFLAYSVDGVGDDRYTLRIRDLRTGTDLEAKCEGAYFTCAWYPDSAHLLYVKVDGKGRPYQVRIHTVGGGTDEDVVLFEEPDERFWVLVASTRSQRYMTVRFSSETESEVRLLDADPTARAAWPVRPRRPGIHYYVEHQAAEEGAGRLLVHHTEGAPGRTVDQYDLDTGRWSPFLSAGEDEQITWVTAFEQYVVVNFKRVMTSSMWVIDQASRRHEITFPGDLYNALPASNPRYDAQDLRLFHSSPTTPDRVYTFDMATHELTLLRERPVLPDPDGRPFDPDDYVAAREWATAEDGAVIPITVVSRRGLPRDGSAPCVLYGYGAYDRSADMGFSINRLSLLDRGFVYAVAHVRGGGELGSWWHDQGRNLTKWNSITDYLTCARHMVGLGLTSHDRIFSRGSSAGGLLVAAALNADPGAFGGVVARVPFVDPMTSMLDEDEPLTVVERDEWGDPADPEQFRNMLSFAPYNNVGERSYPPVLALASRNDTRVRYQQAAKWIARLRDRATGGPFLLWTDMASGHRGRTGRYDAWQAEARVTAWLVQHARAAAQQG